MASCTVTFENVDGTSFKESFSVHNNISEHDFKRIVQSIFMGLAYEAPTEVVSSSTVKPIEYAPMTEEKKEESVKTKVSKNK